MTISIAQICNKNPVTCAIDAEVRDVVNLMREKQVGSVIVVNEMTDGTRPYGIITDRDLVVRVIAAGVDLESLVIRDIATTEIAVGRDTDSAGEAIHVMREEGVKRLPVVDALGRLIGIVSGDDLLLHIANEVQALASLFMRGTAAESPGIGGEPAFPAQPVA